MPPPDFPRLPASYTFDASTAKLATLESNVEPSPSDVVLAEAALRAAVALAQAAHSGEDRYALALADGQVAEGELDREKGEVGSLLDGVKRTRGEGADAGMRIQVVYHAGGSTRQPVLPQTTPVALIAIPSADNNSLTLALAYDTSLLPALEAQWLLSHVSTAFNSLLSASPTDLLSTVALAPPPETSTLSAYSTNPSFSAAEAYPPSCKVLPDFFLHAATLYPDDPAIHFLPDPTSSNPNDGEIVLSFAQTLYLARFLSARLRSSLNASSSSNPTARSAWEKGNLVLPVCVTKSPFLPLSLLAISLTGCGYLALEPSFPEERKRGICAELSEVGMLAPVAIVESVDGEKEKWESWTTEERKGSERVIPDVVDPEEVLGDLVRAAAQGATVEELEKRFPYQTKGTSWPLLKEDGLAYVIYTSGTTGKPKGIMVEHRQVAAFLRNYRGAFGRAHGERVLQFPSYAFDVSVMNIWDTFAHGATLCITTPSSLYSSLADSILALNCTLVDLTPTVAAVLFEHAEAVPKEGESVADAWKRAGFRIKQVNTGGERVEKAVREKWRERGVRVVIDYGPTETTVGVISNESLAASPPAPFSLPIGRPTGNTRIAMLFPSSLAPVPLGCIGEICVLGPQVTRGYVLPKLNEGVFVELDRRVEGVGKKGERVYRTGDLGRWVVAEWEEDGKREGWIECLGRRDGQVKVNGLRIEVGEIEEHLSSRANASLLRGIVDKFETDSISPSLIAYLELSPSFEPSLSSSPSSSSDPASVLPLTNSPSFLSLVDSLKSHLADKLPSYMVPRYWLAVSRIPTQGMGKADRKTLHALAAEWDWRGAARARKNGQGRLDEEDAKEKTFTRDAHHEAARKAWGAVLRFGEEETAAIADEDEFMKLGGDSIRFMKLVGALRAGGYPQLQFKDVVAASTLGDCAAALARSSSSSPSATTSSGSSPSPPAYEPFSLIPSASLPTLLSELANFSPSLPQSRLADVYPTAPSQDALLAPSFDSPIAHYYAQAVYHVGPSAQELPLEKLQGAVREMVSRHEALRSVFVVSEEAGTVVAILKEEDEEVVERTRIETIEVGDEKEMDDAVTSWLQRDRQRFTFQWGVLHLSFALFESPSGARKLGWGMHHAMSDGWTLELLTADLRSLAFDLDLPSRPPFSSVASWWSSNPEPPSETVEFWRQYLNGAQPLDWPSQTPLNGEMLATTGTSILHWRGELDALTARSGITPAIASRVAISVALSHHARSEDVTIGIVRSGRDIDVDNADEVIGPCVSVLPSRTRFSPSSADASPSLLSLAKAEASTDRLSRAHQRITLSQLSRSCALSSRSDLFSILLTFQSLAEHDPAWESAAPWPVRQPPERIHMPTNYALSFEVTPEKEDKEALELACFFDPRVVEQEEVDAVLKSAAKVLDYLVGAPCTTVEAVKAKLGGGSGGGQKKQDADEGGKSVVEGAEVNEEEVRQLVRRLRKEWAAVLRIEEEEIGEQDSFGFLGGDSIAAMRLAVRLKKVDLAIPTSTLAKLPTLRRQAEWLSQQKRQ
ncbi:hypothetical protein JCM6882_003455 [Rhodosporidiobolus microsporus]